MLIAPSFRPDQVEAMHRALKQAYARMGPLAATPVIEIVAIRIVELGRTGEFDPDKLTDTVLSEFDL